MGLAMAAQIRTELPVPAVYKRQAAKRGAGGGQLQLRKLSASQLLSVDSRRRTLLTQNEQAPNRGPVNCSLRK